MVVQLNPSYKKFDGDILLTVACPVECDFCVYSCRASREPEKWMPAETMRRVAEQYSKNGIGVRIAGGEPFYDIPKLEECINIVLEYYAAGEVLIITSGFWAECAKNAEDGIKFLKEKRIDRLVVSFDRFHLKKVPPQNMTRICEAAKRHGTEIVLRVSLDSNSRGICDKTAELITEYDARIEVHDWGLFGRGALIDASCLEKSKEMREYLSEKIRECAARYNVPADMNHYLVCSAKRSQLGYAKTFFPTTYPNGDVYGCSITANGSYMGNLNEEELSVLIERWKNTLPGNVVLSESSDCNTIKRLLPDGARYGCDFCMNQPFTGNPPKNSIGRKFVSASPEKIQRYGPNRQEILISLELAGIETNKNSIAAMWSYLSELEKSNTRFVLSRPVPKCIPYGLYWVKPPKNCYECAELFTVKGGQIVLCGSNEGIPLEKAPSRAELYTKFKSIRAASGLPTRCSACVYFSRRTCDGFCCKNGGVVG